MHTSAVTSRRPQLTASWGRFLARRNHASKRVQRTNEGSPSG
jgi:hypothetical protein